MNARRACTCPAENRWSGRPHVEGCPRYVNRKPMVEVRDAVLKRHSDVHEWLSYTEAWRIDVLVLRTRRGQRRWVRDGEWENVTPDHIRIAYEVKVTRADFLSELRKPVKRKHALDVSHQFFFAVPHGLVRPEEVPEECGLVYVYESGRTRTVKPAPVREPREFTMEEVVYLARSPMYRANIDGLRLQVRNLEHQVRRMEQRLDASPESR